jgi:hypothetical protein
MVCLRTWLSRTACLENDLVDNVARVHGHSVSVERFALRPSTAASQDRF